MLTYPLMVEAKVVPSEGVRVMLALHGGLNAVSVGSSGGIILPFHAYMFSNSKKSI